MNDLDNFYATKDEPLRSCLLALRDIIQLHDKGITQAWKYKMPFFYYNDKMFCYLWMKPKTLQPYIGFVDGNKLQHPELVQEKRARMKIMLLDANKDLPIKRIKTILTDALALHKTASR